MALIMFQTKIPPKITNSVGAKTFLFFIKSAMTTHTRTKAIRREIKPALKLINISSNAKARPPININEKPIMARII